ncbi:MAG: hypothetical protein ACFFFH_15525 [Candidatus Thorarchaeota archaeon]
MPLKFKYVIVYILICVIFSFNQVIALEATNPVVENPIIVLFDEGHGQYFNRSLYRQALSDLIINKSMKIVFNTGAFNSTSFEGVDILVSTNPAMRITREESQFVNRFISSGKAMFLLANPLDEDNESLNGRGDVFNEFLGYLENGYLMGKFWSYYKFVEDIRPTDVVINEFSSIGDPKYLKLKLNSSTHEILSINKNITSIVTYSCSIYDVSAPVLVASSEAYSRTISGEAGGDTTTTEGKLYLMGTSGDSLESGARIVIGGSSIMFSDVFDPKLQSTWYQSENNSYLWWNIFDWLAAVNPQTSTSPVIPPDVLFQIFLILVVISVIFLLGGSLSYSVGSGRKITLVKSSQDVITTVQESTEEVKEPSTVQQTPSSKESRRDRRLQQIRKHQRHRRR